MWVTEWQYNGGGCSEHLLLLIIIMSMVKNVALTDNDKCKMKKGSNFSNLNPLELNFEILFKIKQLCI